MTSAPAPDQAAPRWPTIDELDELGICLRTEVPQKYEDLNGHMNVTGHYLLINEGAEIAWAQELEVDPERAQRGEGTFALAQHFLFHHEVLIGEEVSVHLRIFERSAKVFHGMLILANRTTGKVASTCEILDAFIDLRARRVATMPVDLADNLDRLIAKQADTDWALPLSEKIEVRR